MVFYLLLAAFFAVTPVVASAQVQRFDTVEEYNKAFKGDKPLITLISGVWCGPCKTMKPHYSKVATNNTDILFCIIDVDNAEFEELYNKWSVRSVPTFIFSHKGFCFSDLMSSGGLKTHDIEQKVTNFRYEMKKKTAAKQAKAASKNKTTAHKKA